MTQAKTQSTDSSEGKDREVNALLRNRRVEDELRLRELELQTNFQIKTLTESLNYLKAEFHSWKDSLNQKFTKVEKDVDSLKTRTTILIALLLGQMAGIPGVLSKILGG